MARWLYLFFVMCEPILHNINDLRTIKDTDLKQSQSTSRKKAKRILSNY